MTTTSVLFTPPIKLVCAAGTGLATLDHPFLAMTDSNSCRAGALNPEPSTVASLIVELGSLKWVLTMC